MLACKQENYRKIEFIFGTSNPEARPGTFFCTNQFGRKGPSELVWHFILVCRDSTMRRAEPLLDILKSGMVSRWRMNEGLAGHWIKQWLGVAAIKGAMQASTRWLLQHFGPGAVQQLGGWPIRPPP